MIGTIHQQGDIKPGKLVYNLVVTRHSHSSENVNTDVGQLCTRSEHCHASLHWLPV